MSESKPKKRGRNWEAYSRDRAYTLLSWLRRQGVSGLNEPQADAIRIWMRVENSYGYRRAKRATGGGR